MEQDIKRGFRRFQLKILGWVSICIAPISVFVTTVVYDLPFPKSISECGTIANQASPILPYCLGALALFAFSYSVKSAYDKLDVILTRGMAAGFTIVAIQMCESPYIKDSRVGLLGLSEYWSGLIHNAGAVLGFGSMILWILICFRKSNRPYAYQTNEKHLRDDLYTLLGWSMAAAIISYGAIMAGFPHNDGIPALFIIEMLILTFGGLACLVKGGLFLRDKGERDND